MALINCPECAKEISDKAAICPSCGYPISEYLSGSNESDGKTRKCPHCNYENRANAKFCENCGMRLVDYENNHVPANNKGNSFITLGRSKIIHDNPDFDVYRTSTVNGRRDVKCPRCGSPNFSIYYEQHTAPEKTKARYTANLNPLRPFTLVNKKEKVVRKERVYETEKFICNNCGKKFP